MKRISLLSSMVLVFIVSLCINLQNVKAGVTDIDTSLWKSDATDINNDGQVVEILSNLVYGKLIQAAA